MSLSDGRRPLVGLFRRSPKAEEKTLAKGESASGGEEARSAETSASPVESPTAEALERTRRSWFHRVSGLFDRPRLDESIWDELEEVLIGADTGVATTEKLLERLRERVDDEKLTDPQAVRAALQEEMVALLADVPAKGRLWDEGLSGEEPRPAVILVVGVNGTGKTTSIAKLAHAYRSESQRPDGRSSGRVIIAAADTFRAAAIDQMKQWGERVGADVVAHRPGADPSAVVFDALTAAESRGADTVIIDTAGRFHTKFNLMEELRKIRRVIERKDPSAPHEVLLVLDATTGQNALVQARAFAEAADVTAICLTKLDGTSKGGIVFAICDQLGIPVRFVGTGEGADDLAPFSPEEFVAALFA